MGIAPVKEGEGRPPVCNAAVAFRAVYGKRARAMVVRSASITVPRNAPFSRTTTPRMVEPKGEHTSSFNWPGCLPDSSTSFAEPKTAYAAICCDCGRFSPSATPASRPSPITSENNSSPKRFRRYSFSSPSAVSGSSSKRTSILSMRRPSITRAIIVIFVPSWCSSYESPSAGILSSRSSIKPPAVS